MPSLPPFWDGLFIASVSPVCTSLACLALLDRLTTAGGPANSQGRAAHALAQHSKAHKGARTLFDKMANIMAFKCTRELF